MQLYMYKCCLIIRYAFLLYENNEEVFTDKWQIKQLQKVG